VGEIALKFVALGALAVFAVGCGSKAPIDTSRTLSVQQVLENIDSLNGRRVKVGGFLPDCGGYDCSLFTNEQQAKDFWRIANNPGRKEKLPDFVEIGSVRGFDEKAGSMAGHYVVVTGRVTNECHPHRCTDRGPDLVPIDIALSPQRSAVRIQS
jgi:hypothetical protein